MSVIVIGCGRSGTNMALEILSGSTELKATSQVEDKNFTKHKTKVPDNYLSKCDTCYCTTKSLKSALQIHDNIKIIWTIRNPKDMCLSKLKRGLPISDGGDCKGTIADDATYDGCIKDIEHMYNLYREISKDYSDRIVLIKMENLILNLEHEVKKICQKLGIKFNHKMLDFTSRMRNEHKKKRYGNNIDKSQVDLWKNYKTIYNGFFKDADYIESLFNKVSYITKYFGYED